MFSPLGRINLLNEFHAILSFMLLDFVCKVEILAERDEDDARGKVRVSP